MKKFTVFYEDEQGDEIKDTVQILGLLPDSKMTPLIAYQVARTIPGHCNGVSVYDGGPIWIRIYSDNPTSYRKYNT